MRFNVFRLLILLTFLLIAAQLYRLQIASGDLFLRQANTNRFRQIDEDAPRGIIYDRNGILIARNTPRYALAIVPTDLPEADAEREKLYQRLAKLVDVPVRSRNLPKDRGEGLETSPTVKEKGIEDLVRENQFNPLGYVTIKDKIDRTTANIIEELRSDLPGVQVLRLPARDYPFKEVLGHLLGYTGGIPADEYEDYVRRDSSYARTDRVGVAGLEYTFENDLRGIKGLRLVEVDSTGREVRSVVNYDTIPGKNLVLTLDVELQKAMVEALKAGLSRAKKESGVAIAMDPRNGEILAMVSWPGYDNNLFASGISVEDYTALIQDPRRPLFNRAISGQYPFGSIFKIVPASAALQEGVVDITTGIVDSGVMWVPNKFFPDEPRLAQPFYGWNRQGLGLMNVTSALAWSSDIYFYQVAGGYQDFRGLGLETYLKYMAAYGIGKRTEIELPGEAPGILPSSRWKRETYAQSWVTGDTYNMGIGQGFLLGTPLQILNATAAVANDGTLYKPRLTRAIVNTDNRVLKVFEPEVLNRIPVSSANLAIVREGLRMAVTSGTAPKANLADIRVAGKTGTAEYPGKRDRRGFLPTHAWFTAFAPYDNPQIALVVFVEDGGEGSQVAVPIAADILRAFFRLPKDSPLATEPDPIVSRGPIIPIVTTNPNAISESPQAGARAPFRPPDAPRTFKVRVLAQETWSSSTAGVFGWVRDRNGTPLTGLTLTIEGGNVAARATTVRDGSFRYDLLSYDVAREWRVRLEGQPSAEVLTLQIQPSTKYTILFYEE